MSRKVEAQNSEFRAQSSVPNPPPHFSSLFQYATSRKFRQAGWNLLAPKCPTGCQRGFFGCWINRIEASLGVRLPLRTLQARHAQTTFSQVDAPPRESG